MLIIAAAVVSGVGASVYLAVQPRTPMEKGARVTVLIFPPRAITHNYVYGENVFVVDGRKSTMHILSVPPSDVYFKESDFSEDVHIPFRSGEIWLSFWSDREADPKIFDRVISTFKFTEPN